jgi:hypothetical protein
MITADFASVSLEERRTPPVAGDAGVSRTASNDSPESGGVP